MADLSLGLLQESIAAHGQRLEKIEHAVENGAEEWKNYLVRDRKATCAAPDMVDAAGALVQERLGRRMDGIEGIAKVNMALQSLQALGIVAGLLKAFGVL